MKRAMKRAMKRVKLSAVLLALVALACFLAPAYAAWVSGADPFRSNIEGTTWRNGRDVPVLAQNTAGLGLGATPVGPGWHGAYLLGADGQGRDVAARLLYGGRTSLLLSGAATAITLVLAGAAGLAAGAGGRVTDGVLRAVLDLLWAFPVFLLAVSLSAVLAAGELRFGPFTLGPDNPALPALILGLVFVPYVARPVRTTVLELRDAEFVHAAVAAGSTRFAVVRRHLLPEAARVLALFAPTVLGFDILTEASLSVLGVGVQPPGASWGTLIADGQGLIYSRPAVALAPGLAVVVTVVLANLLADELRGA